MQTILEQLQQARANVVTAYDGHYEEAHRSEAPSNVFVALDNERRTILAELDRRIELASPIPMPEKW